MMESYMKILAISGSAYKDSCYSVLRQIKNYFADNGYKDFQILELSKIRLDQCKGCSACVFKGEENCPNKDGRDIIINKIKNAQAVIFASPDFSSTDKTLMKTLIDRLGFFAQRPAFFDKYAMVISTSIDAAKEETNKHMIDVLTAFGFNLISNLQIKTGIWPRPKEKKEIIEKNTLNAAKKFLDIISKGKKKGPKLDQVVVFRIFKKLSESKKDNMPVNYDYYKDKKEFYYDVRMNMFKKMYARYVTRNL
jgi:multimeric flavodoxin WrbA